MTEEFTNELADRAAAAAARLAAYVRTANRSVNKVAPEIGYSTGAISTFIRGEYKGDVERVCVAVEDFLARVEEREGQLAVPYAETTVARRVTEVVQAVHIMRVMGLLYGPSGTGKTLALKEYVRKTQVAVYLQCDPSVQSPKPLAVALLDRLGAHIKGNLWDQRAELVKRLSGSDHVIILDDADALSSRSFEFVRGLFDETGVGILLCGDEVLYDVFTRKGPTALARFWSRIAIKRWISPEVAREDVKKVLVGAVGKRADGLVSHMYDRAQDGGLRLVVNQLRWAYQMATLAGEGLSLDHVREAEKLTMV